MEAVAYLVLGLVGIVFFLGCMIPFYNHHESCQPEHDPEYEDE